MLPAGDAARILDYDIVTTAKIIIGGPGRTRTCNQTVMSGPACSTVSENIDVFRGVAERSSTFVHVVPVVNRWLALWGWPFALTQSGPTPNRVEAGLQTKTARNRKKLAAAILLFRRNCLGRSADKVGRFLF